ncbi:M23 family metallopeptidase, partial [Dissulfurirhabdus thermomarina]
QGRRGRRPAPPLKAIPFRAWRPALAALAVLAWLAPAWGAPAALDVTPAEIPPGGIALVRIHPPPGAAVRGLHFRGRAVPVHPAADGGYVALVGAGLRTPPGRYDLVLRLEGRPGRRTLKRRLRVRPKSFPAERLKLPEKMVEFPPKVLRRVRRDQEAVRRACGGLSPEIHWEPPFLRPVDGPVLSPFGLRRILNGQPRSPHSGVDLRAAAGTPVRAANAGRVVLARDCYLSGKTLVLDHGGGLFSIYAHLAEFAVTAGQQVRRGQVVGRSGASGRATGPHLHWGVSLLGERLDPEALIALLGSPR